MNTVESKIETETLAAVGSIWRSSSDDFYMLCEVGPVSFVCICLSNGGRWCSPVPSKEEATEGLRLAATEAKITIEALR